MKKLTRRQFHRLTAGAGVSLVSFLSGCAAPRQLPTCEPGTHSQSNGIFDYVVVGSGAGGGPLAANLARLGHRVLLLDAGGDEHDANYQVPLFHPKASEDPAMRWDFFVRHYGDHARSRHDPKFIPEKDGVFYPRCSTLGGCTAHNAMILMAPHNKDWDDIASHLGDHSWSSGAMRKYWQRLENCGYVKAQRGNPSGHGFNGWLPVNLPGREVVRQLLFSMADDPQLHDGVFRPVLKTLYPKLESHLDVFKALLLDLRQPFRVDPNDQRHLEQHREGLNLMPLTTEGGRRTGPREYVRAVEKTCDGRLSVQLNSLVSKILLDDANRAIGVEIWRGRKLYCADRNPTSHRQPERVEQVRVRREVILAGGAFNTPQLLLLSGIGPAEELKNHGIPQRVDLPGVGSNLQDRYEVSVVCEMQRDFEMLKGANFTTSDPLYRKWQKGKGLYTTNGALISFSKQSQPWLMDPDLFVFGMPGMFRGYYPGYSRDTIARKDVFTWAILKAHTRNHAGTVKLRSADPRDPPLINFRYFEEGSDKAGNDLAAVAEAIHFVRSMTARAGQHLRGEMIPGPRVRSQSEIEDFIRAHAWGHHASCSCPMGPDDDQGAVVDSRFRVRGVGNLRIVDASVFPKIPGFFIVSAIYMIAEKATDVIHNEALAGRSPAGPT